MFDTYKHSKASSAQLFAKIPTLKLYWVSPVRGDYHDSNTCTKTWIGPMVKQQANVTKQNMFEATDDSETANLDVKNPNL